MFFNKKYELPIKNYKNIFVIRGRNRRQRVLLI